MFWVLGFGILGSSGFWVFFFFFFFLVVVVVVVVVMTDA